MVSSNYFVYIRLFTSYVDDLTTVPSIGKKIVLLTIVLNSCSPWW